MDIDSLTPDDVYIGTSQDGTFYSVPEVFFSTKDILDQGSVRPAGFISSSGSITLEEYGTQYGDRLKGSFVVQVEGTQRLCPTPECDVDKEISGTSVAVLMASLPIIHREINGAAGRLP